MTRRGFSFYAEPYKSFKSQANKMLVALNKEPMLTRAGGTLDVTLHFVVEKPASTILPCPKPDLDNFEKAILDAANKVLYEDDWLIQGMDAAKWWAGPDLPAGIYIDIHPFRRKRPKV